MGILPPYKNCLIHARLVVVKPYLVMLQEDLPGKINIFFIIIKMILLMAFIFSSKFNVRIK
jgi:hypothetical protein